MSDRLVCPMKKPWKTSPTVAPNAKPWQRFVLVATLVMAIAVFSNVYLTPAIARDLENQPKTHDQLTFPPLPEINLPEYERYTLPNGLVVYLMPDRRLPLVSGSVVMRAGSRWEPADQVGLAQLTGTTMRLGGTEQNSPAQLNDRRTVEL